MDGRQRFRAAAAALRSPMENAPRRRPAAPDDAYSLTAGIAELDCRLSVKPMQVSSAVLP
jgi:hypothetical protein